jgi:hypothetical protein
MLLSTILVSLVVSAVLGVSWIAPGAVWYDTDGNVIDAHGAGIYREGHIFYLVGHSAPDNTGKWIIVLLGHNTTKVND